MNQAWRLQRLDDGESATCGGSASCRWQPRCSPALSPSPPGVQQLWWVGVLVIFGLIPLIDGLLGEDVNEPARVRRQPP